MNNRRLGISLSAATVAVLLIATLLHIQSSVGISTVKATSSGYANLTKLQKRWLSGVVNLELNPRNITTVDTRPTSYFPVSDDGCPQSLGANIKINQNCLNLTDSDLQGRGQAENETAIAVDPNNPAHLVAGFNDYRRGDSNCFGAYSLDQGKSWTDTGIPTSFTRGTNFGNVARQYWQAAGDPSVAWDTRHESEQSFRTNSRKEARRRHETASWGTLRT